MIKIIMRIGCTLVLIILFFSCKYQESFTYTGSRKVNFTTDSLYFSFGKEPFSITDTTIVLKAELIGVSSVNPLSFAVDIDKNKTTAIIGEHYDGLLKEYRFEPGQSYADIPIHIHRRKLDETKDYIIRLSIVPMPELSLGVVENRSLSICFNNSLDKPLWWNSLDMYLGEYNVRKYQKFIEIFGRPVSDNDIKDNKYGVLRVFKKVKIYFDAEPYPGVIFPDVKWPVW